MTARDLLWWPMTGFMRFSHPASSRFTKVASRSHLFGVLSDLGFSLLFCVAWAKRQLLRLVLGSCSMRTWCTPRCRLTAFVLA